MVQKSKYFWKNNSSRAMRQIIILIALFAGLNTQAQKIVSEFSDVKNPKNGKLYFSEKENSLSIFGDNKFQKVFKVEVENKPEPPKDSTVYIGYWELTTRKLEVMLFSDGYYLIQTDGNYIVARGKNLLKDSKTKVNTTFDLTKIKSGESNLGGLFSPDNFPSKELINRGYKLYDNGEYRKDNSVSPDPEPTPEPVGLKTIPSYHKPTSLNTEVFSLHPTINLPRNLKIIGGYGFPLFKDTKLDASGKVDLLNKGFTNLINLNALERSKWAVNSSGEWSSDKYYYFQQAYHLAKEASKSMRRNYNPAWGTLDPNDSNPSMEDYDYSGLTKEGAKEMGRHMILIANSVDNKSWNIDATSSVLMIDEESIRSHKWQYGSHYDFLGYIKQGIYESSKGKQVVFIYAQPVSRWFHNKHGQFYDLTDKQLKEALSPSNITMSSTWNGMRWYVDANGAYFKVPFLSKVSLYKKDAYGNYLLKDGKRVYRDDNSTIDIFQSKNIPILNQPEDKIKWCGWKDNGQYFEEWQEEWGKYDSREMTFSLPEGWKWHNNSVSYRAAWKSEYEHFVEGVYYKADAIMQDLLLLSYKEKGKFDIYTPNKDYLLYVEHRPATEPWTTYGNYSHVREVGDGFIYFDTFMSAYSGAKGLSTWDDGRYLNELTENGEPLYWDDIEHVNPDGSKYYTRKYWDSDWTRYHSRMSAIYQAFKDLQDTDSYSWKHIHFYQPYFGRKNKEVISSGVHYNNKLHIFFINPSLENGESQELELKIGDKTHIVTLKGHEFYYQTFEAKDGISPKDFKLSYKNIYGKEIRVNGVVTDNIESHYD